MANEGTRKAFDLLRKLPRVTHTNVEHNYYNKPKKSRVRNSGPTKGAVPKSGKQRQNFMPVGYETGNNPFYLRYKSQHFYKDYKKKLSYMPLHLQKLQMMIDTNRVRMDIPLDVTQLCNSGLFTIDPANMEGGFLLEDEGQDCFCAEINLEVQWATESIIAAIERAGSTITTAYYDPFSLDAAVNPMSFFTKGKPIPRRMLPPQNLIEYYSNPKNRGYLADPDAISEERLVLAQKYGYTLPDISKNKMLLERKDPRQVFYGLEPGWVVSFTDKNILKPTDPELMEYYKS